MRNLWVKMWRLLWRATVASGVYFWVSRTLWKVLPSERKRFPLSKRLPWNDSAPSTLGGVVNLLEELQYKRDPFFALFDYFHHPEATWRKIQRGERAIGDCDDWAIFAAALLRQLPDSGLQARILNVFWIGSSWRPNGHNVCLYKDYEGDLYHISNWRRVYGGEFKRGRPWGPYKTVEEAVESIASRGDLVGWCTVTPDLEHITARG